MARRASDSHDRKNKLVTNQRIQDPNALRRTKSSRRLALPARSGHDWSATQRGGGCVSAELQSRCQADHALVAQHIRRQARHQGRYVGILADLQGPKIRIGGFSSGAVTLQAGDPFN